MSDEVDVVYASLALMEFLMRMWGGSLTSSSPFLVQVTFGVVPVVDFAVQYSWITDCCTTLRTPPLFSKSRFGSEVTVNRALTAVGKRCTSVQGLLPHMS